MEVPIIAHHDTNTLPKAWYRWVGASPFQRMGHGRLFCTLALLGVAVCVVSLRFKTMGSKWPSHEAVCSLSACVILPVHVDLFISFYFSLFLSLEFCHIPSAHFSKCQGSILNASTTRRHQADGRAIWRVPKDTWRIDPLWSLFAGWSCRRW